MEGIVEFLRVEPFSCLDDFRGIFDWSVTQKTLPMSLAEMSY
jgi:hypothetical protein